MRIAIIAVRGHVAIYYAKIKSGRPNIPLAM